MYFIGIGLLASLFLLPSRTILNSSQADKDQTFFSAIKRVFFTQRIHFISFGFFVCGFQITLVETHIPGYMQEGE